MSGFLAIEAVARALDSDLSSSERLVLIVYIMHASQQGHAWPAIPTVSRKSGLSVRTVRASVRNLTAAGILTAVESRTGKSIRYMVNPDAIEKAQPRQPLPPATIAARQPLPVTPATTAGGGGNHCRGGRQPLPGGAATIAANPSIDPSKEPSTDPSIELPSVPAGVQQVWDHWRTLAKGYGSTPGTKARQLINGRLRERDVTAPDVCLWLTYAIHGNGWLSSTNLTKQRPKKPITKFVIIMQLRWWEDGIVAARQWDANERPGPEFIETDFQKLERIARGTPAPGQQPTIMDFWET